MKILQVFDLFSLSYGGGTVDIMLKLSKALSERGHEVTIYTSDYKLDRVRPLVFEVCHSWINLPGIRFTPKVDLDVRNYDAVHFHCYRSLMNAVLYQKVIKYGVPYVIDAHGSTVDFKDMKLPLKKLFDNTIGYKALKNARHLIAETDVGLDEYVRLGVDRNKITMLHPFLDVKEFKDLPNRGLFREKFAIREKYIVLFLGRIHKAKGIEYLLESVNKLRKREDNLRENGIVVVIVGQDDGYQADLVTWVFRNSMRHNVLFTGFLSGVDKLSALVDADVLVQPSKNEAGARPALEAILCGTPAIVTRNNGAGYEIAKMDGGYLVDYGDSVNLAKTIKFIIDNPAQAMEKVYKGASFIKENLSLEKQIVQYERLYGS